MKKLIIWAVISALLLIGCGRFLAPCIHYYCLSENIRNAEVQGESQYFDETAHCLMPNWCRDGYQERYNAAVEAKKAFIEESDVANWLSTSAETLTGSVVRLIVIAEVILVFFLALIRLFHAGWLIVKRIFGSMRVRTRRKHKKTAL